MNSWQRRRKKKMPNKLDRLTSVCPFVRFICSFTVFDGRNDWKILLRKLYQEKKDEKKNWTSNKLSDYEQFDTHFSITHFTSNNSLWFLLFFFSLFFVLHARRICLSTTKKKSNTRRNSWCDANRSNSFRLWRKLTDNWRQCLFRLHFAAISASFSLFHFGRSSQSLNTWNLLTANKCIHNGQLTLISLLAFLSTPKQRQCSFVYSVWFLLHKNWKSATDRHNERY